MNNCPVCAAESAAVAQLREGSLFKCSVCHWLFSQDVPIKPIDKSNPSEEKRNEYLAIVHKATMYAPMENGDKVLDVYSGDGTLLGWYTKYLVTVGVEPNVALMKEALNKKRVDVAVMKDFTFDAVQNSGQRLSFKIITVIDVLQDLNMLPALQECAKLLAQDGVLVLQIPYFPQLLKEEDFPQCQNYFLTYTLKTCLQRANLEMQGSEFPKRGIRVYATHPGNKRFAISDYTEKLRLYTTMNTAFMQELHARYDLDSTYKILEEKLHSKPLSARNDAPAYLPPTAT